MDGLACRKMGRLTVVLRIDACELNICSSAGMETNDNNRATDN